MTLADQVAADPRLGMSERQLQDAIVELAKTLGWKCYHTFDSRRSEAGYPDLTLVRDRIVYVEVKAHTGVFSKAQQSWIDAIRNAGGEAWVIRPRDWLYGDVEMILAPGSRPTLGP